MMSNNTATSMNEVIQDQLGRVELALTTLIDSIAAHNPSIPAANDILAADADLQKGLEQLAQHQANHARIFALHQQITQQNARITKTLTALADTRTDLISTPTSLPPKDTTRNVPYTELLDYAKRISQYTVPPNFRAPLPSVQAPTIAEPTPAISGEPTENKDSEQQGKGIGTNALGEDERQWLEPLLQVPFVPWVNEDTMRRGALAQIQAMLERGENPADVDSEGAKEEQVKEEGQSMEDVRREQLVDMGGRDVRREPESKPAVFSGLDLYDPDEDDD